MSLLCDVVTSYGNAPKLQLLNVLFLVIEDVLPEGVSFQDLHVLRELGISSGGR